VIRNRFKIPKSSQRSAAIKVETMLSKNLSV
jgi:hypothetical protein